MAAKKAPTKGVIDAAFRAATELDDLGVAFALVGGLAVGARVEPRFTRDVDLVVSVASDDEAERVIHTLTQRGYVLRTVLEHTRAKRLATARLQHPRHPGVFLDLLFASSGIEPEIAARAERIDYRPGTNLPVARIGHLIAMKVLSEKETRLQDRIDLQLLAASASASDWKLAEQSARLIRARGFHRGRALRRRLRRWRQG